MCTVILLRRPGHPWPLILAANRDERLDRAWDPPAEHWPEYPGVVGGRDRSGGGSWMAMGPRVIAAVLNRPGSLGPAPGKRSRGELTLLTAAAPTAEAAVAQLAALDAAEWRPFNLVVADRDHGFFLRGLGAGQPQAFDVPAGVSMVTAHDLNDLTSPRIRRHLPRFRAAPPPDPASGDWRTWAALLADDHYGDAGIGEALRVPPVNGFGTVCSSLAALGAAGERRWLFCPGPAGTGAFTPVRLPP